MFRPYGKTFVAAVRRYSSALYVTGEHASKSFAVLTPALDIEERLNNKVELTNNLRNRKYNHIDVDKIESKWTFYKHLANQKAMLEYSRAEISKEITRLTKEPIQDVNKIEIFKTHAKMAKNDLLNLKDFLYGVEEAAALAALSLPNILHPKTPLERSEILFSSKVNLDKRTTASHHELAKSFFRFCEPSVVYLQDDAALYELFCMNYLKDFWDSKQLVSVNSPNFSTGVIVEGCAARERSANVQLQTDCEYNTVFLTGGASIEAFMAYFARFSIQTTQFPIRLYSIGRTYQRNTNSKQSLLHLNQTTSCELFVATKDDQEQQFNTLVEDVIEMYSEIGYHFRVVSQPAPSLMQYESMRCSFEMYSNHMQEYVEVGYISLCDTYLSKRLLVSYSEQNTRKYAQIVHGNIFNIHRVLACIIENSNQKILSDFLRQFSPI